MKRLCGQAGLPKAGYGISTSLHVPFTLSHDNASVVHFARSLPLRWGMCAVGSRQYCICSAYGLYLSLDHCRKIRRKYINIPVLAFSLHYVAKSAFSKKWDLMATRGDYSLNQAYPSGILG